MVQPTFRDQLAGLQRHAIWHPPAKLEIDPPPYGWCCRAPPRCGWVLFSRPPPLKRGCFPSFLGVCAALLWDGADFLVLLWVVLSSLLVSGGVQILSFRIALRIQQKWLRSAVLALGICCECHVLCWHSALCLFTVGSTDVFNHFFEVHEMFFKKRSGSDHDVGDILYVVHGTHTTFHNSGEEVRETGRNKK